MDRQHQRCGKCFTSSAEVVEKTLGHREEAFNHYEFLIRIDEIPMMCETPTGAYRVCYVPRSSRE